MKKRTSLVCFLIFTLCVFYTATPSTVFGQDAEPSLAEQIAEKYKTTLEIKEVQELLPDVLTALSDPATLEDPTIAALGGFDAAVDLLLGSPILIKQVVPTAGPEIIALLGTEPIQIMFKDPEVRTLMQDAEAVKEFAELVAPPDDGTTTPPDDGTTTPPDDGTTTPPDDGTTTPPDDGTTTPPDDGTTTPPDDGTTPPDDGTTTPPDDGTTPPDDGTTTPPDDGTVIPPPDVETPPPSEEVTPAERFGDIMSTNPIAGNSRLGGLSLNRVAGGQIIEDIIDELRLDETGLTLSPELLVKIILDSGLIPKGFFPENQIQQFLLSDRQLSAFNHEEKQLDFENFGNAITPNFADFAYTDYYKPYPERPPTHKYLTRDSLQVYVRVPAKVDSVAFELSNGTMIPGRQIKMGEFQSDTIPYTFRLEETVAATHLPAWPSLDTQLFSSVKLRWSDTPYAPIYNSVDMDPTDGKNGGVVWTVDLGIPPDRGSTYYFFEVVLAEELHFVTLDRGAIATALESRTVTLEDIFSEKNIHAITIDGWAMPDPRNLQLLDRGIIGQLFTDDLREEFGNLLEIPEVLAALAPALVGQQVDISQVLKAVPQKQMNRIRSILLSNTNRLTSQFEQDFDPLLASVLTVPKIDMETQSLWVPEEEISVDDGTNYYLKADVLDADGNVLDRIQENFTVDTRAPEADIRITPGANANSYFNTDENVYIATAPTAGTAAMINIMGEPRRDNIGPDKGYLFYQMIGLDGKNPDPNIAPNTWMPLTVESTMLTSKVWNAVLNGAADKSLASLARALGPSVLPPGVDLSVLDDAALASLVRTQTLESILSLLDVPAIQGNPSVKFLADVGLIRLDEVQAQLIVDALGATVKIIDHLVPVTFDRSDPENAYVVMPIQGEQLSLMVGDYGIRAMGIDTLLNVGAYAEPTYLRIVAPTDEQRNRASVTLASIGDHNDDGLDPRYEHNVIYANTTEDVVLTITIDQNPHHLANIVVQYQDANGAWQDIGEINAATLIDAQIGGTYPVTWNVPDAVNALVDSDGFGKVMVRAVATNQLQLTDETPKEFAINLDAGDYPPGVLKVKVDEASITNPDSGAPQGMVTIHATTLPLTGPRTKAVRFEAKRPTDEEWITLGTDDLLVSAVEEAVDAAVEGTSAPIMSGSKATWSIEVNTADLKDTITKDTPAARDASMDNNQYTIRAFAVTDTVAGIEWPVDETEAVTTMLSVDNVDDVEPLGPTTITAVANAGGMVEADPDGGYTLRGLIDDSPFATFTIQTAEEAKRDTYESVKLVNATIPGIEGLEATETSEGVFEITVNVGMLGIAGNGTYKIHAVAYDAAGNVQSQESSEYEPSPEITVHLKNYERPDPAVVQIDVDHIGGMNADSGGEQGEFTFTGYTLAKSSPEAMSIRLEAKRASDTDWTTIDTVDTITFADEVIEDAELPGVLDHLVGVATEGTDDPDKIKDAEARDRSVVAIDTTYNAWSVTVDTRELGLEDTITKDSPGARDVSIDDNQYTVRAFAVDADGNEFESDARAMFSLDNVDDVAPLGPTNVSVTDVMATANSVLEGSYTVGGLVDKYDSAVDSPVATFTITPTADPATYQSVNFYPSVEGLLITEVVDGGDGSFTVTVDVGTLDDAQTYLDNGMYMFHALAYDEFGNEQADETETDDSKISVTVANTYRPAPQVLAFTVDDPTQTNPDSDAPQGMLTLNAYLPEITSAPTTSVMFEVKRKSDTEWTEVGTASESSAVTAADDAKLAAADVAEATGDDLVEASGTYQKWMIEVDTTTLEDSIDKDNPGARDVMKDDNQYMIRATASATADGSANPSADGITAMFSVDNVDDVAPLGPTNVTVTNVEATDSVFEAAEDGSYTVGGLVDKYDDNIASPVATFTITPDADRDTYESVRLVTDIENLVFSDATETEEDSGVFTVTVDIGTLADGTTYLDEGTYMFHALAKDKSGNEQTKADAIEISVTVDNSYRPAPKVLALAVDPDSITQTNPDSGAPQGMLTINAYSHGISSPPTTSVRLEVKRPGDPDWIDVGTATESTETTEVSDADLTDFVGTLATAAVSETEASDGSEAAVVSIGRMWTIDVDTTALEDTIAAMLADDTSNPAARDAAQDTNQYSVRAVAIAEADESETVSADTVTAMFSVDNTDDVEPLGPTNIVNVADVAGDIVANEDGSYTVGGIVDDTVPSPVAIFTTEPMADPNTYASVNLVQTTEDGTETVTEGEAGTLGITIDIGMLENGTYMFHALAVDEFGNVQTDESPKVTLHVVNFRVADVTDIAVTDVDGIPDTDPIQLRESITYSFKVANGSLAAEELSGGVNGADLPSESAEDPENTFTLMVTVGGLPDGLYTPDAVVTKRNGSVAFSLDAEINVDNTPPAVTIESPIHGGDTESLPTVHATYTDNHEMDGVMIEGSGVDGATGTLALARLQPPDAVEVEVDQAELEKDTEDLVYTVTEQLPGGAYRVTVEVADMLGNVGSGSREFTINGTLPTVKIQSITPGQTFDHGKPLISGEFTGIGEVEVTRLTINRISAKPEVDGNQFSYTPEEALADGDYTVVVKVADADGNTAQTSAVFTVDRPRDTTPPVISAAAPNGIIKDTNFEKLGAVVISAVVTDEQSAITSVKYSINDERLRSVRRVNISGGKIQAPIDFEEHGPGLYTIHLVATSEGGTTAYTWTFTLVLDNVKPVITSITPSGTIRAGLPVISASANDESGIQEIKLTVMDSDGKEVKGKTRDDSEKDVEGITRLDFNPDAPLDEGTYTIDVLATDMVGNFATSKGNFTVDFDTAAPVITMASPSQDARLVLKPGDKAPTVSISYADAESGVNLDSITLVIEGAAAPYKATPSGTKINLSTQQKSATQVTYPLMVDTNAAPESWVGEYVVRFEVADNAHLEGNVSDKNKGARAANRAVHTFSFQLEAAEGPVMASRPLNYPNPFKDNTRISFSLARQATVSIVIYDVTLRPVRVLVDNRLYDAGQYTLKNNGSDAIGWDGKSSSGEDLARGIYFCEIIVTEGFEPEYAILKLALTR